MANRKVKFVEGEYYHIWNRGVDKRDIFTDPSDIFRFVRVINTLNTSDTVNRLKDQPKSKINSDLVEIISYCINKNHYHFILKQKAEGGISKFMHKFGTAYTNYFNKKEGRSGSLFQGKFKSSHIDSNGYLLWLFVYVNLNNYIHLRKTKIEKTTPKSGKLKNDKDFYALSSWSQYNPKYIDKYSKLVIPCDTEIISKQIKNTKDVIELAHKTLPLIVNKKILLKELEEEEILKNNI